MSIDQQIKVLRAALVDASTKAVGLKLIAKGIAEDDQVNIKTNELITTGNSMSQGLVDDIDRAIAAMNGGDLEAVQ
tara:strand:- start:352 stop:579 length:228 start_codon:yes stop_codon:yes gene_type:complete